MNILTKIKTFAADESGAVTVDWVVLTAAIVGLGIAVVTAVGGGLTDFAGNISDTLSGASIAPSTTGGAASITWGAASGD